MYGWSSVGDSIRRLKGSARTAGLDDTCLVVRRLLSSESESSDLIPYICIACASVYVLLRVYIYILKSSKTSIIVQDQTSTDPIANDIRLFMSVDLSLG